MSELPQRGWSLQTVRAIDRLTPEELETLKLKGMLAMRHTPYASNDDEAKDYELDRLEREQDILEGEENIDVEHMKRMLEHCKRILEQAKRIVTERHEDQS